MEVGHRSSVLFNIFSLHRSSDDLGQITVREIILPVGLSVLDRFWTSLAGFGADNLPGMVDKLST